MRRPAFTTDSTPFRCGPPWASNTRLLDCAYMNPHADGVNEKNTAALDLVFYNTKAVTAAASAIDSRRFGEYTLLAHLASGGMGELYLARPGQDAPDQIVVIKRVLPHLARDTRFNKMLLSEARIAARLSHPNVCRVSDVGDVSGRYYIAMEYLEGVSLLHLLSRCAKRDTHVPPEISAGLIVQAAAGLHAAHSLCDASGRPLDLVHRDVSPGNLFITAAGQLKVLDFGVAKSTDSQVHTRTGAVKGKWAYMAPEQIRRAPLDRRSDVFALGIVAFECFTGHRLYRRNSEYETAQAITENDAPSILAFRPEIRRDIADVVARALSRDPTSRFATAEEFGEALAGACDGPIAASEEIASFVETLFEEELADRRRFVQSLIDGTGLDRAAGFEALPTVLEPESGAAYAEGEPTGSGDDVPTQHLGMLPKNPTSSYGGGTERVPRRRASWYLPLLASLLGASVVAGAVYFSMRPSDEAAVVVYRGGVGPDTGAPANQAVQPASTTAVAPASPGPSQAPTTDGERANAPTTAARATAPKRPKRKKAKDPFNLAVAKRQSALVGCFRSHAKEVAGSPKVAMRFHVRKDGTLSRTELVPAELEATTLGTCLTNAVRDVTFPAGDAAATVTIPLRVRKR